MHKIEIAKRLAQRCDTELQAFTIIGVLLLHADDRTLEAFGDYVGLLKTDGHAAAPDIEKPSPFKKGFRHAYPKADPRKYQPGDIIEIPEGSAIQDFHDGLFGLSLDASFSQAIKREAKPGDRYYHLGADKYYTKQKNGDWKGGALRAAA